MTASTTSDLATDLETGLRNDSLITSVVNAIAESRAEAKAERAVLVRFIDDPRFECCARVVWAGWLIPIVQRPTHTLPPAHNHPWMFEFTRALRDLLGSTRLIFISDIRDKMLRDADGHTHSIPEPLLEQCQLVRELLNFDVRSKIIMPIRLHELLWGALFIESRETDLAHEPNDMYNELASAISTIAIDMERSIAGVKLLQTRIFHIRHQRTLLSIMAALCAALLFTSLIGNGPYSLPLFAAAITAFFTIAFVSLFEIDDVASVALKSPAARAQFTHLKAATLVATLLSGSVSFWSLLSIWLAK